MGTAAQRNALDGANIKRVIQVSPSGSPAGSAGDADAVVAADQTAVGVKGYNGTTWDRLRTESSTEFNLRTALYDGANQMVSVALHTDAANGNNALSIGSLIFNGTTWDRVRNNTDGTALASAARTATANSADLVNYNGKGLHVVIDVTAITATPSVVFTIQGKDALSGQYYTVLASAAITATGTTILRVHPGLTAAANTVANDLIPRTWRVNAVHADGDSITYSVGYSLVV